MHSMPVNLDKPQRWKEDVARSVDQYNQWFLNFAPTTYRTTRVKVTSEVEAMLMRTNNLRSITTKELNDHPGILFALRMSTAPPLARDRLVGLAGISKSLVGTMELEHRLPPKMAKTRLETDLGKIAALIMRLADVDIFTWLETKKEPSPEEVNRGATIVADRLCGAQADPIVRNAQEQRQLAEIKRWLEARKYKDVSGKTTLATMQPGTFAFRLIVPGLGLDENADSVNIPIDAVVMPHKAQVGNLPLLIEAKSAGDFTNVNKRRKEEATKVAMLRRKQGSQVRFILFLCGYFDSGYLGYEAAEGIDWVWEHRIDDLAEFGL
jgi:hypothetical protein